uniref:Uncharacterized protein n=1 Tax=Triticum urartu TaxID=4572 RepID=A0A8R7PD12_TRIUA
PLRTHARAFPSRHDHLHAFPSSHDPLRVFPSCQDPLRMSSEPPAVIQLRSFSSSSAYSWVSIAWNRSPCCYSCPRPLPRARARRSSLAASAGRAMRVCPAARRPDA